MHVGEYLISRGISEEEFATRCCASKSTVYLWKTGKSIPSELHMDIIIKVTNGVVTENDIREYFEKKSNEMLSIQETAKVMRVQKQTVMKAIREGRLKAEKVNRKWFVPYHAIDDYKKGKYDPESRLIGGKRLWNVVEGKISPQHAAKMLKVNLQTIYRMIKMGKINTSKVGVFHLIDINEIEDLINQVEDLRPLF